MKTHTEPLFFIHKLVHGYLMEMYSSWKATEEEKQRIENRLKKVASKKTKKITLEDFDKVRDIFWEEIPNKRLAVMHK